MITTCQKPTKIMYETCQMQQLIEVCIIPLICTSINPGTIRSPQQSTTTSARMRSSKNTFSGLRILPSLTHRSSCIIWWCRSKVQLPKRYSRWWLRQLRSFSVGIVTPSQFKPIRLASVKFKFSLNSYQNSSDKRSWKNYFSFTNIYTTTMHTAINRLY